MTIKGGSHVSLNGVKYLIDESADGHYVHKIPGLFARQDVSSVIGEPTKRRSDIKRITWSTSDWSGGEGNRVFYDDQMNVYDYGVNVDTRIPGQFTGRPKRFQTTVARGTDSQAGATTGTITRSHYGRFFDGGGKLYYFVDNKIFQATDGSAGLPATWASVSPTMESTSAFTTACGDNEFIFASAWKDDGTATSAERTTMYSINDGTTWRNLTTSETINGTDTGVASANAYFGMVVFDGRLYTWTGRKLNSFDIKVLTGSNAIGSGQSRQIFDSGAEPDGRVFGDTFWADIVDCGTSICFFASSVGRTMVYQMSGDGVSRPLWSKIGFTTKSLAFNNGTLYIAGTFSAGAGSGNPGHGAIYEIPLDTLSEHFLKWVRKTTDSNLEMQVASASVADRVTFCAAKTGRVFVYDADFNSLSLLDDLAGNDSSTALTAQEANDVGTGGAMEFTSSDHRIGDVYSWGPHLYTSIYRPATSGESVDAILAYANDEPTQRMKLAADATAASPSMFVISPEHDMGYPADAKLLLGFHVSFVAEGATMSFGE